MADKRQQQQDEQHQAQLALAGIFQDSCIHLFQVFIDHDGKVVTASRLVKRTPAGFQTAATEIRQRWTLVKAVRDGWRPTEAAARRAAVLRQWREIEDHQLGIEDGYRNLAILGEPCQTQ